MAKGCLLRRFCDFAFVRQSQNSGRFDPEMIKGPGPVFPAKRGDYIPAAETIFVGPPAAHSNEQPDRQDPGGYVGHHRQRVSPDERCLDRFVSQTSHRPDAAEKASKQC